MTTSERSSESDGAGVAAGRTLLATLAVCESLARQAIGDPLQRNGAVLQARRLLDRADEALVASTNAYLRARQELAVTLSETGAQATGRDAALHRVLTDALDALITLASVGADAAVLAAALVELVEASRRPDAAGVAELAVGAVHCLRHLAEANLALTRADQRRDQIAELASAAEQAAASARRALAQR
jgi:hypothetical protein